MICALRLKNGLSTIGNLVNETDKQITLRIHANSPYPQVRSFKKEDVKEIVRTEGIKGLAKKALKESK